MVTLQIVVIVVLAIAVLLRSRAPGAREWLHDAPLVFVASWLGEDTCIRLYDFYKYAPGWWGFIDQVPPLIPAIWVFVVLSARDIARALAPKHWLLIAFAVVWYDALLVEPIATYAGMWIWLFPRPVPGPFYVPLIGPLGWALFAVSFLFALERMKGALRWLVPVAALAGTHALLLAVWWGALRWLPEIPARGHVFAVIAAVVAVALCALAFRRKWIGVVPLAVMAPRFLPAAFFFYLLTTRARWMDLWLYALTFVPAWVLVTDLRFELKKKA